jgi:hypothetical protein
MEVSLTRSFEEDPGGLLRQPSRSFILIATISFSAEDVWVIDTHNLYHHAIVDRTPQWYYPALRENERAEERAKQEGERYDWPWHVPRALPEEWVLTAERALHDPIFAVTFETAQELNDFEPRMIAAFAEFARFLRNYGARPRTITRRF